MATINPDLESALRKLDEELEEGDITKKGYEKRRTLILSQYLSPSPSFVTASAPASRGLRIHSADDSDHPASLSLTSNEASRAASLAALTGSPISGPPRNGTSNDTYPSITQQREDQYRSTTPKAMSTGFKSERLVVDSEGPSQALLILAMILL